MAVTRFGVQPIVVASTSAMGVQTYRMTAVTGEEESEPSLEVSVTNDLSADGNVNFIHWAGEGDSFRVYRSEAGMFARIGETDATSFVDDGIVPEAP